MAAVGHWGCRVGAAPELLATVGCWGAAGGHPRTCVLHTQGCSRRWFRPSVTSRHRPGEVRGEEHLQTGAVPALGQRCGAGRGDTSFGDKAAGHWNSDLQCMEYRRAAGDRHCRHNYELSSPFLVERRGERGAERVPSGRALGMTLEPLRTSLGITRDTSALLMPIPRVSCPLTPSDSGDSPS
ncbi:hypothetical protein Nmel_012150, partial [Mimus melanotis]